MSGHYYGRCPGLLEAGLRAGPYHSSFPIRLVACVLLRVLHGASMSSCTFCAMYANRLITDRDFPLWMTKAVLRQVLQGIDFMHQNQIAHGDVQPGNILFGLQDLACIDESLLIQNMTPRDPHNLSPDAGISEPVQSLDSQAQSGAPKYLAMDRPLTHFVRFEPQLDVKISDLGAAFPFSEPPMEPLTPVALQSPECVLGAATGPNQDIWSFGCPIYQFLTGYTPFTIVGYDDDEEDE